MSLQALSCVIKKLSGYIAPFVCYTSRCSYASFKCIRNSGCSLKSLATRFGNLFARLFKH